MNLCRLLLPLMLVAVGGCSSTKLSEPANAHAKYLASSKTAKPSIEGNGDERGGSEYNLAVGQQRSDAVLKSLQLLGAPTGEMEAVSFGKERRFDLGHDENAWAKNRRTDFKYVTR